MPRLNIERQQKLEPTRMSFAKNAIKNLGFEIHFETDKELRFNYKGHEVKLFPYSGWHTGKSIVDGRGIVNLLKQLLPKT